MKKIFVQDVIDLMTKSDNFFWNNKIIFLETAKTITRITNVSKEKYIEITEKYTVLSKEKIDLNVEIVRDVARRSPWTTEEINLLKKYQHDMALLTSLLPNRTYNSIITKISRLKEDEKNKKPEGGGLALLSSKPYY
ncbi:hypothetical protein [Cetobacterium sp.]|uniref:hypothetical protein n=1 Tax=Cetobacterium sp. TaxID=2071632 RepID=UPI003EE71082